MNDEKLTRIVEAVTKQFTDAKNEEKHFGLKQARKLIAMVEAKAKTMGLNIVAAVSNEAGRPIAIECMDNSYIASYDVALNKAYTVVALKMSTKKLSTLAKPDGPLYGIQHTNGGQIVIFGGGDPLIHHGKIVGGLGVSGGSEEQDTALSAYGASVLDDIMNEN